jgi:hypothetical protein
VLDLVIKKIFLDQIQGGLVGLIEYNIMLKFLHINMDILVGKQIKILTQIWAVVVALAVLVLTAVLEILTHLVKVTAVLA